MKLLLIGIIAAGIVSRLLHTGSILFDKYLGDALYAAMIYVLVRLVWPGSQRAAWVAMAIMTAIELFQLTRVPAHLLKSKFWAVRMAARLMGTEFSFLDLAAYAVGIAAIHWAVVHFQSPSRNPDDKLGNTP